jgi:hypothetical protein
VGVESLWNKRSPRIIEKIPSLHFLRRVAAALGTELEIRFRPREGMDKKELSKTTAGETAAPTYMYPEQPAK